MTEEEARRLHDAGSALGKALHEAGKAEYEPLPFVPSRCVECGTMIEGELWVLDARYAEESWCLHPRCFIAFITRNFREPAQRQKHVAQ